MLRDVYVRGKYRGLILPMTVIRSLDTVLEPTKQAVLDRNKWLDETSIANQDSRHHLRRPRTPTDLLRRRARQPVHFIVVRRVSVPLPTFWAIRHPPATLSWRTAPCVPLLSARINWCDDCDFAQGQAPRWHEGKCNSERLRVFIALHRVP